MEGSTRSTGGYWWCSPTRGLVGGLSLGASGPFGVETRLLMVRTMLGVCGEGRVVESEWGREDSRRYPTKRL